MMIPEIVTEEWPVPGERVICPLDGHISIRLLWPLAGLPSWLRDKFDIVVRADVPKDQCYTDVVTAFCDSVVYIESAHREPGRVPLQAAIRYDELHALVERVQRSDQVATTYAQGDAIPIYRLDQQTGIYFRGYLYLSDDLA